MSGIFGFVKRYEGIDEQPSDSGGFGESADHDKHHASTEVQSTMIFGPRAYRARDIFSEVLRLCEMHKYLLRYA